MNHERMNQKDIKKFFIKSLLFLPLVFMIFVFPTLIMICSGEMESYEKIIAKQRQKERVVMVGHAYNNQYTYFKLLSVIKRKPEIIALGSSRVMAFRSTFFNPGVSFYNAGSGVRLMTGFREFLKRVPLGQEPKFMIIGLDQSFFNANWPYVNYDQDFEELFQELSPLVLWKSMRKNVFKDYFINRKFSLKEVLSRNDDYEKIGLHAITNHYGLLNDGSFHYGEIVEGGNETAKTDIAYTLNKLETGAVHFEHGQTIAQSAITELEKFLLDCKQRNIYVIGILPPYPTKIYQKMKTMEKDFEYIFKIAEKVQPVFDEFEYDFYDFSDISAMGAADEEAYDGGHASEKAYVRAFIEMAENNDVLAQYVNIDYLKKRLWQTTSDFVVFDKREF